MIENHDPQLVENRKFSAVVDRYMQETRHTFMSVSGTLGLISAALPPALMFAFASHDALVPLIGPGGALTVAIALAVALEATGVKVAHTALEFFATWREGDREALAGFITASILTGIYLAAGAIAIIRFDDHPTIRLAGLLSYIVAAIMYIGSGLEVMLHARRAGTLAKLRQSLTQWQAKAQQLEAELKDAAALLEVKKHATYESKLQQLESELAPLARKLADLESQNADLAATNRRLERQIAALQDSDRIVQVLNPLAQDVGRLLAGDEITQVEIASRHNVSESTVSRMKSQLNGQG